MKKIVAAASIAALAATAAFADAKITLNNRTKLDAFASVTNKLSDGDDDVKVKSVEWMDWAGYDGAGAQGQANASDGLKFVLDGERAGVTLNINVAESVASIDAKLDSSKVTGDVDDKNKLKDAKLEKDTVKVNGAFFILNQYSAWAKWDLGPGSLKIEAGNWKDGYADGAYRVKKDVDAQNAEGMDFERFKLGSILKGNKGAFADELGASNSAVSGYATYSVKPTDDIGINFTIGGNYTKFDSRSSTDDDGNTTTKYFDSTFVGRLQFNMADLFNSEIIYKQVGPHNGVFGIFVKPTMLGALDATIGFSMDKLNEGTYGTGKEITDKQAYTDWAFDLRARYAFSPAFSMTLFTNISGTNLEAGRNIASGVAGHKGAEGLWLSGYKKGSAVGKAMGLEKDVSGLTVKTAMWNNLSCRYKINDTLSATLNVGLVSALKNANDDDETKYAPEWRVTPAVQVYAGSNASVWAGVALSGSSMKIDDVKLSTFAVQVPVIFRVKM